MVKFIAFLVVLASIGALAFTLILLFGDSEDGLF